MQISVLDGEAPVMELWGVKHHPVVHIRVQPVGQIDLFKKKKVFIMKIGFCTIIVKLTLT